MNCTGESGVKTIIFVGNGTLGSNALSLFDGFQSFVPRCYMIGTQIFDFPPRLSIRNAFRHFFPKFYGSIASKFICARIKFIERKMSPDVLFVFKGIYVTKECLESVSAIKVHYHPDDSSSKENRNDIFEKAESIYNLHFTSKKHNVTEIADRTKKPVFFIWYAYDQRSHFREEPLNFRNPKFMLGFIGHMRPDRNNLILEISRKMGKKFAISGLKWNRNRELSRQSTILPPSYGKSFSKFIHLAPMQLGLLNSSNRDQHTARSFEIPASGGLIIAQDTLDHREIFGESGKALYFKNLEELKEKIDWAIRNPDIVSSIAENGFLQITRNSNTWTDRAREILNHINNQVKI